MPDFKPRFDLQPTALLTACNLKSTPEGFIAKQPKHQGSGNIDSLSSADGLTLLKPGQSGDIGEQIEVYFFEGHYEKVVHSETILLEILKEMQPQAVRMCCEKC